MIRWILAAGSLLVVVPVYAESLPRIRVSDDGLRFVESPSGKTFQIWGVNYDHDGSGRLLDEYWIDEWATVVEDFHEIKQLGANCVRIHLQFGLFMQAPGKANTKALQQLGKLLKLAEDTGLYLDITGLACYHKQHVPAWYDALEEQQRWQAQADFWSAIAKTCRDSPAVFCYDLMNEPVLAGQAGESDWLLGELGGKYFVQRLVLDLGDRSRQEVARAWVEKMARSIREQDTDAMITVGVIPWVFAFGGGKPLFYTDEVGQMLDFVSVHFYPKSGEIDRAIEALQAYEVGKPLVIEEMFPLKCSPAELVEFVEGSRPIADGWISFYWGRTEKQLRSGQPTLAETITADWLKQFQEVRALSKP